MEGVFLSHLLGGGDLADLTKGKDKRETVGFRADDFCFLGDEESSSLSEDSQEEQGELRLSLSMSDELNRMTESFDLIGGINMR